MRDFIENVVSAGTTYTSGSTRGDRDRPAWGRDRDGGDRGPGPPDGPPRDGPPRDGPPRDGPPQSSQR